MSGGDTTPEKLTDQQRIDQQVAVINVTSGVSEAAGHLFGRPGLPVFGKTNFEDHSLNALLDLVHGTNPADLEHAGGALGNASKAINEAAEELRRHLKHAGEDWKGEAGTQFQQWGENLATQTEALAKYAEDAKVQISTAATGLASVRSAMPARDTRPSGEQKKPTELPEAKQVDGNRQYAEAVRVEKDRQEAINQMNRLASFYSVSGGALGALVQDPPVFAAMPNVGVPRAPESGGSTVNRVNRASGGTAESGPRVVTSASNDRHVEVPQNTAGHTLQPSGQPVTDLPVHPHNSAIPTVGTEINSVGTLPSDAASVPRSTPSAVTSPNGPPAGTTIPPMVTGTVPPAFGGAVGRALGGGGTTGGRAPVSAQGRVTTPEGAAAGTRGGRAPLGQVGRAAGTGQPGARGPVSTTGRPSVGRGVTGGMPRAGGTAGQRASAVPGGRTQGVSGQPLGRTGPGSTGAARTGGVVGGRPTAESGATPNGARVPRGTVVGGEDASTARATGEKPGQRGVIGANDQQLPRRSLPSSDRMVGASGEQAGSREKTTPGGSGRGKRPQKHAADGKKRRDGDTPSETD